MSLMRLVRRITLLALLCVANDCAFAGDYSLTYAIAANDKAASGEDR
jgi:hypothetical protein